MAVFQQNPIFDNLAESERDQMMLMMLHLDYLDQEERLTVSDESSESTSPDAKRARVAAAECKKFTFKSGPVWTTSVPIDNFFTSVPLAE
ncbi:hypothetical protein T4A_2736 [Trichinella pseudospiralis]|nr:hypothetical protein T4A_2736 [Trichinella pseudospiralis]